MHLEETVEKIKQELNLTKGLTNIKVYIQNFTNEEDTSYIEFKAVDTKNERKAFKLYSKWSNIIKLNCPEILTDYHNLHVHHNNNLRRIWVYTNAITNPDEKKQALSKASLYFYHILKEGIKYQK